MLSCYSTSWVMGRPSRASPVRHNDRLMQSVSNRSSPKDLLSSCSFFFEMRETASLSKTGMCMSTFWEQTQKQGFHLVYWERTRSVTLPPLYLFFLELPPLYLFGHMTSCMHGRNDAPLSPRHVCTYKPHIPAGLLNKTSILHKKTVIRSFMSIFCARQFLRVR